MPMNKTHDGHNDTIHMISPEEKSKVQTNMCKSRSFIIIHKNMIYQSTVPCCDFITDPKVPSALLVLMMPMSRTLHHHDFRAAHRLDLTPAFMREIIQKYCNSTAVHGVSLGRQINLPSRSHYPAARTVKDSLRLRQPPEHTTYAKSHARGAK